MTNNPKTGINGGYKAILNPTDLDSQPGQFRCQQDGNHYYASNSVPGSMLSWIRQCMTCGHFDAKDIDRQLSFIIARACDKARIDELKQLRANHDEDVSYYSEIMQRELQLKAEAAQKGDA